MFMKNIAWFLNFTKSCVSKYSLDEHALGKSFLPAHRLPVVLQREGVPEAGKGQPRVQLLLTATSASSGRASCRRSARLGARLSCSASSSSTGCRPRLIVSFWPGTTHFWFFATKGENFRRRLWNLKQKIMCGFWCGKCWVDMIYRKIQIISQYCWTGHNNVDFGWITW